MRRWQPGYPGWRQCRRARRPGKAEAVRFAGKDRWRFSRHNSGCPMVQEKCRPPVHRWERDKSKCRTEIVGGGRLPMHRWRTRRPGYPLVGCSPAEPTSVSPGGRRIPLRRQPCKVKDDQRGTVTASGLSEGHHSLERAAWTAPWKVLSGSACRDGSLPCCSTDRVPFYPKNP